MIGMATYLAIAASVWGPTPCGPQPQVSYTALTDPRYAALAIVDECRIEVDSPSNADFDGPMRCSFILHEYGHLVGMQHSDNPRSIMQPLIMRPDPRCSWKRLFKVSRKGAWG